MKKIYAFITVLIICIFSTSNAQIINSLTVVPANPNPQDTILLLANCTFSTSSCDAYTKTINQTGNNFYASAMHCLGFLTVLCGDVDTFIIGPLPVGNYKFLYQVDQGFGGPPCTPGIVPGPSDSIGFIVDSVTSTCSSPSAGFNYGASGLTVSFADTSQTTGIVYYSWDFGDFSGTDTIQNPSYTYTLPGVYNVCLTVTDSCGTDISCQFVTVIDTSGGCNPPTSGFTYATSNLSASFTDTSATSGAVSYYWTFGDMLGTDSIQNPNYTYSIPGTYNVCLTVTDSCGSDVSCYFVTVMDTSCPPPVANFIHMAVGSSVAFFDSSATTGLPTYYWDFGDSLGGSSILPSPIYTYSAPGTYYVCLIVTDSCGSDTACQTIVISSGCPPPIAGFTYTTSTLTATFTDSSTTTGSSTYSWDFGDFVGTSTIQNPSYTYLFPGVYNVCLTVTDSCGTSLSCQLVTIIDTSSGCPPPVVAFTYTTSTLTATFTDSSTTTGSSTYMWNFGDFLGSSTSQNPSYTYAISGVYNVCLTVTDSCGTNVSCQLITILDTTGGCPPPIAGFTYTTSALTATFTDSSTTTGSSTYSWDFGDFIGSSTSQNPSYTYLFPGVFNVCLTVTDSCGTNVSCQLVTIVDTSGGCPPPAVGFTYTSSNLTAAFNDTSTTIGAGTYFWTFGDLIGTDTAQNPSYTYLVSGTYNVCLTVVDSCGSNISCQQVTVTNGCTTPMSNFNYTTSNLSTTFTDVSTTTGPTTYFWTFGDFIGTDTVQNPTYTYSIPGTYNVCLTVTDTCGVNISCQLVTVTSGCPTPVSNFNYSTTNLSASFTDVSTITGAATYSWDFGDLAGTSSVQNPSYTYTIPGVYNVCLTVTDSCGTDLSCQLITVTPVGIPNIKNDQVIVIYPNPVSDIIYFRNISDDQVLIYIYDALGSIIQCLSLDEDEIGLHVEDYSEGIYFYRGLEKNETNILSGRFTVLK